MTEQELDNHAKNMLRCYMICDGDDNYNTMLAIIKSEYEYAHQKGFDIGFDVGFGTGFADAKYKLRK